MGRACKDRLHALTHSAYALLRVITQRNRIAAHALRTLHAASTALNLKGCTCVRQYLLAFSLFCSVLPCCVRHGVSLACRHSLSLSHPRLTPNTPAHARRWAVTGTPIQNRMQVGGGPWRSRPHGERWLVWACV